MLKKLFGEILTSTFDVKQEDVDRALKFQEQYGGRLGAILVNMGVISEEVLVLALSLQLGLERLCEDDKEACDFKAILEEAPLKIEFLLDRKAVPIGVREGRWTFASVDPLSLEVNGYLAEMGVEPCFVLCTETQFRDLAMRLKRQDFGGYREAARAGLGSPHRQPGQHPHRPSHRARSLRPPFRALQEHVPRQISDRRNPP